MREKIQSAWLTLRRYWQRPKKGEEVAYKEIAAFSVGSMGIKSFGSIMSYIQMSATCLLTASVYGLSPRDLMWLFIITNVIGVVKTPFISMLVDNTDTAIGKFRPYILWAGIPSLIAIIGLTWLVPVDGNMTLKIVLIGVFFNLLSIAQPLLNNAQVGISQVISSDSRERTKIMGFSEFLGNLGPSIIQFLLPTLGLIFFGESCMENIWTYRIFMPILALAGFFMGFIALYYTQERVVLPKSHVNKVKFAEGMKILAKNKEFWLVTISKFFDGFKGVLTTLLPWVCAYQLGNSGIQGIVQTITSIGFTPGIVLAPLLISKLGTRKSGLIFNFANCVAAAIMFFTFKQGFVFFVISLFIYNFANGPQYIIGNTIMSDGFDAQQDKMNVRIEGFAQNFQLMVSTVGTIVSTVVFTFVYESNGLVADEVTGITDYSILANAEIREPIISTLILIVIGASFLAALPYFFVTLDRKKMKEIRASLEYKKVIADLNLTNASAEEQQAAYDEYLAQKKAEDEQTAARIQAEKDALKERQLAAREEEEAFRRELEKTAEELTASGAGKSEIRRAQAELKRARKEQKRAKNKAAFDKLREDQRALSARRKEFCKNWVAQAKAEGKKHWLRVLAREEFSRILAAEANSTDTAEIDTATDDTAKTDTDKNE